MVSKDSSKQWFETGDYPTQSQFAQVFEWLRWKDEPVAMNDVTGLQAILNTIITLANVVALYAQLLHLITDTNIIRPAGDIITGIIIDAQNDFEISIGTTPGGNDIINALHPATVGKPEPVNVMIYSKAEQTIYISGITQATDVLILKNSVPL